MKILVTGGAGFIGSAVVRSAIEEGFSVLNVDALTYAANLGNLKAVEKSGFYRFEKGDIRDRPAMEALFRTFRPDAVIHLAAESHVDRSIDNPNEFLTTNVMGTFSLLEAARIYQESGDAPPEFRFVHVSTDEVYGDLSPDDPAFVETTSYKPSSPYSASKAASDHLVRAWGRTYGLPVIVSNCSNNYGSFQFPEKLIPVTILNALHKRPIPIYGDGSNVRDWLYVEDHANALLLMARKGIAGETYNVGGNSELSNLDLVHRICARITDSQNNGFDYSELITFVTDRPGHDRRYAVNTQKIYDSLSWSPSVSLEQGLSLTVKWYLENKWWWTPTVQLHDISGRLGQSGAVN